MINIYKRREVATFDVPRAYLHADMPKDKKVLLKLKRNISGYNVSDNYGSQEERGVQKLAEGIIYVVIT